MSIKEQMQGYLSTLTNLNPAAKNWVNNFFSVTRYSAESYNYHLRRFLIENYEYNGEFSQAEITELVSISMQLTITTEKDKNANFILMMNNPDYVENLGMTFNIPNLIKSKSDYARRLTAMEFAQHWFASNGVVFDEPEINEKELTIDFTHKGIQYTIKGESISELEKAIDHIRLL